MKSRDLKIAIKNVIDYRSEFSAIIGDLPAVNGKGWTKTAMICPLHAESDGSFYVNVEAGRYNCFGCGGGDFFDLYCSLNGVTFGDAIREIGGKYGLLDGDNSEAEERARRQRDRERKKRAAKRNKSRLERIESDRLRITFDALDHLLKQIGVERFVNDFPAGVEMMQVVNYQINRHEDTT